MRRLFDPRLRIPVCLALLFCALLLAPALPAAADGIIIPNPPRDRPITWREIPLAIKYHRVDVSIKDQVATTHVDQVFVNEASFPVEGTYIFPLPEDAAISSFDMWVDGQKLEGKLLGREEARAIYEDIVRKQRDPALLEYVGRGAFQASIFPIPPSGERRIELTYSQVLPLSEGLVHYRYPLNTEKFSARQIADVSVTVRLEDKAPLRAVYSPSHPVTVVRDGDRRTTITYAAKNVRPDRDFDLFYSLSTDAVAVNLLSYKPYDEDGFFLLLVTPPVEAQSQGVIAKDVILVFDTSGSMDGEKLVQAKAAADYVIDHLGERDRFNIVSFNTSTRLFSGRPVEMSQRSQGHEFVKRLTAQGSTDINRALLEAFSGADKERPTVVIFLTDGLPTMGEKDPDRILANATSNAPKSVRLFAFGVGYDVDTMLLDQLSAALRGTSAYVKPGQKIDEEVSGFYAKVSAPVLMDVKLDVSGVRVEDMYPYPLPDLFAGNQLIVAGRYRQGGPATVKLSGTISSSKNSDASQSQTYAYNVTFAPRGGDDFIARLWAQRKIGYLLAQIRLSGAKDELVKEVIALSTRYGIVTPYTSFLVQEPQLALTQGGRDQLSQAPTSAPAPAPAGAPGAQATAAPSAMQPLAPTDRSGEKAVERAVVEGQLKASEQAVAPAAQQVKQVGDKTFLQQGGVWLDTTFDASTMQAEEVLFGSDRYFQLLGQHPEIGPYLALGDRVVVMVDGKAYAVGSAGQSSALPGQPTAALAVTATRSATATPVAPAARATAAPTATPGVVAAAPPATRVPPPPAPATATSAAPPRPTPGPPPGGQPGQPPPGGQGGMPPICAGTGMIGLAGMLLPVWVWRRRSS